MKEKRSIAVYDKYEQIIGIYDSIKEISEKLGLTTNAIKSTMSRQKKDPNRKVNLYYYVYIPMKE